MSVSPTVHFEINDPACAQAPGQLNTRSDDVILDVLPNKKPQANDYMYTAPARTDRRHHMTEEQPPPGLALTDLQHARIEYARRALVAARTEDLAQLEASGLILIVERLRGRLDDMLNLLDEISHSTPPGQHPNHHHP